MIFAITKFPRVAPNGMHIRIKVGSEVGVCTTWNETSLIQRNPWSFSGGIPASELARRLRSYLTKQLEQLFSETISDSSHYSQYCQASETRHHLDEEKWWPNFEGQELPDYNSDAAFWTATWRKKELKINCDPRVWTTTMSPNKGRRSNQNSYNILSCNYTWLSLTLDVAEPPLDYLLGSQLEPGQNMLQWGVFWLNVMHLHP